MRILVMCMLVISLFTFSAYANDVIDEESDILEIDELISGAPNDVNLKIDQTTSLDEGLGGLWSRVKKEFAGVFTRSLSCIGVVLVVSVMGAIVSSLQGNTLKKAPKYIDALSAVAISAAASGNINTFIGMSEKAISDMKDFSNVLFPTLAASVAASGSPVGAVVRHSASVLFSSTFISIISAVLIPLLYTYIASATANAAIGNLSIGKICSFLEWLITGSLKIVLTVFLAYISISGFVASTSDMAGAKTISAISNAIPVVGGILSNATGAVLSGAKVLKNAIGIFGLISVMAICLSPCLVLSINYFVFKAASAILTPICEVKCGELIGKIGTAFGIMLAITASCALLLFIAIISCMFAMGIS